MRVLAGKSANCYVVGIGIEIPFLSLMQLIPNFPYASSALLFLRGVFSQKKVSSNELPMVMCLYPGIYTRGIPIHAMQTAEYLANRSPPSNYGLDIGENAYIMNLNNCGGYIDGCALESQYGEYDALDINPSACGHLVNHDAARSNVEVISFAWDELVGNDETMMSTKEDHFALPNELRANGFPWYYDTALDKLVSFSQNQK